MCVVCVCVQACVHALMLTHIQVRIHVLTCPMIPLDQTVPSLVSSHDQLNGAVAKATNLPPGEYYLRPCIEYAEIAHHSCAFPPYLTLSVVLQSAGSPAASPSVSIAPPWCAITCSWASSYTTCSCVGVGVGVCSDRCVCACACVCVCACACVCVLYVDIACVFIHTYLYFPCLSMLCSPNTMLSHVLTLYLSP